jgi:hypothetical protein
VQPASRPLSHALDVDLLDEVAAERTFLCRPFRPQPVIPGALVRAIAKTEQISLRGAEFCRSAESGAGDDTSGDHDRKAAFGMMQRVGRRA